MPNYGLVATIVVAAGAAAQQAQWYPATLATPAPHDGGAVAYDSIRDRVVLAGGLVSLLETFPRYFADTWEWDGARWIQRAGAGFPARYFHQMAFDLLRRRMVTWGGETRGGDPPGSPVFSTYEYDGAAWQFVTGTGPVPRTGHVMTYDPVLQRVLMFGGFGNATWSWDGVAWTVVNAPGPPGRRFPAQAYDTRRNRWVVFGGREISTNSLLGDLWEWDGSAWTQRSVAFSPPPALGSMAFDAKRGVAVLAAGTGPVADLWEWNGVVWTHALTRSLDHVLGNALWHAGTGAVVFVGMWQVDVWDGRELVGLATGYPRPQPLQALSPLGAQLLLVTAEHVWQWQRGEWRTVGGAFPGHYDPESNVVEDTVRNRLVCVVPSGALGSYVNEWDGTAWDGPIGGVQFSRRRLPAVAFDRARGRTVLFGGFNSSGLLQDTWEWQLGLWQARASAHAPSPRWDAAMAWDPQRGEVLLFGGSIVASTNTYVNDTWTWDGADWRQLAVATPPPPLRMNMVLHEVEGSPYLFSRLPANPGSWRWTGSDWQVMATPTGNATAFDRGRGQFVQGVGWPDAAPRFFGPHVAPAVLAGGAGCGAPRPRLQLSSPYLGNPGLAFEVDQAQPASVAVLLLGTQPVSVPLPGGCTASVGGATSTRFFVTGPGGFAALSRAVPAAPGLLGLQLHAQAFVLDGPTGTLSATDAQIMTLGN